VSFEGRQPCLSVFRIDDNMMGALEHAANELLHIFDDQD
jgi:hypothetical protein